MIEKGIGWSCRFVINNEKKLLRVGLKAFNTRTKKI